jgi:hypothetical protein
MDGAAAAKLVSGEAGYVLEDVPHVSDYLPDLPVSAASRAKGFDLGFDAVRMVDRCFLLEGEVGPLRGIVVLRRGREKVESDDDWWEKVKVVSEICYLVMLGPFLTGTLGAFS